MSLGPAIFLDDLIWPKPKWYKIITLIFDLTDWKNYCDYYILQWVFGSENFHKQRMVPGCSAGRCLTMDLSGKNSIHVPHLCWDLQRKDRKSRSRHENGWPMNWNCRHDSNPWACWTDIFQIFKSTPFFCWNKPQQKRHKCSGGPGCHRCHQQITSPTLQLKPISPLIRFVGHQLFNSMVFFDSSKIIPSVFCHWNETKFSQEFWQVLIFETHIPTMPKNHEKEFSLAALVFVFGLRMAHTEDAFCCSTYTTFGRAGLWQTRINLTP